MSNLLNNNNYYNLSAYSLKLNGLDVQTEIDNLTNAETWTNTDGGSVEPSTGLVLITNGIGNNAVANESIEITDTSINLDNNVNIGSTGTTYQLLVNGNPIDNSNVWINADGITTTDKLIPFTDGTANGMKTDNNFSYAVEYSAPTLTVGNAKIVSANNNMVLETTDYILTKKDIYLQGTEDVQRYLTIGLNNVLNNVKTFVDINTQDYICRNELNTRTQWKLASEYTFDSDVKIGAMGQSKKLYVNDIEITPSGGGLSAGLLRALNVNQIVPTLAQTYDIVWSNLSPAEQAIWAGGAEPPTAGAGNSWNFTKLVAGTQKINWTLPFDFLTANLKFQEIQSVYAIVRLNTSSNISQEGYMWFEIKSQNTPQDAPNYRTRWNYANSASGVISQLGNTYKIYASDAIPLSTAASNTGKGQEPYPIQSQYKSNPVDVEPTSLFSIPFSKFVLSPTGDTSAGYTSALVQSIALNTASNINTYNFDVIAIGFNDVRYNLFFA
jgi:hypothetical protein